MTPTSRPRHLLRHVSLILAAGVCSFSNAEPTRFATTVVSANHGAGQNAGTPEMMLGGPLGGGASVASLDTWSLGNDPTGSGAAQATLRSDCLIADGPGPDFIVFENAILYPGEPPPTFAELMFVEVSSDGIHFARFPSLSTNTGPVGPFGGIDPKRVTNLAGARPTYANIADHPLSPSPFDASRAGGTAFNLGDLISDPFVVSGAVNLQAIRDVRLVDVYGDGIAYRDSIGMGIVDATNSFNSADVEGIAVINGREGSGTGFSQQGRDAGGNARLWIATGAEQLAAPLWETTGESLAAKSGVVVCETCTPRLAVAWGIAGEDVVVKAFNAQTGERVWTSPALDAGFSVMFESRSIPCVDVATESVLFATGRHAYRLRLSDGGIEWDTEFPASAGVSADVVNSSFHVSDGLAWIATYGGFAPTGKRLYALDVSDGGIVRTLSTSGPGSEAPPIATAAGTDTVFTLTQNGMEAYGTDGALLWTNEAPLEEWPAWSTTDAFFGGLVYAEGALFASTYGFSGAAELVAVDARTGRLLWKNDAALSSSGNPLLQAGTVTVLGHVEFGEEGLMAVYDAATGEEISRLALTDDSTTWEVSAVTTSDVLCVTEGAGTTAQGLRVFRPGTTQEIGVPMPNNASGTVAVGLDGTVYGVTRDGGIAAWRLAPVAEETNGWLLR